MKILVAFVLKIKKILSSKYENNLRLKIQISLFYVVLLLVIFSLFRLLFCIVYRDAFASLLLLEKAKAFAYGLRFDISTIGVFVGFFIALMFLPISKKQITIIKIFNVLMALSTMLVVLLLCADFFYFPEVKRHITEELVLAWMERSFIIRYAISNYWWVLLVVFVLMFLTIKFTSKLINTGFTAHPSKKLQRYSLIKSTSIFIGVALLIVMGIRGRLDSRPLNTNDVYRVTNKTEGAQLMLNGVFTQYRLLLSEERYYNNINNYPIHKALQNVWQLILSQGQTIPDNNFPLMRQIKNIKKTSKNYNVAIILLESWTPHYIDSLNDKNTKYNVTPNFDEIVKNGITFSNAYAVGSRSLLGLSASFSGVPLLPGMIFTHSIDLMNNKSAMPDAFNKRGYFTMYVQSPQRDSVMMCYAAKNALKVQESYGKEDIPLIKKYLAGIREGYDYEMFDFAAKKATQSHKRGQPFFIYLFTGSTHMPFVSTTKEFEKYTPDTLENKYLNSLYYADYSINHFLEIAKKEGFFDNTIFIFMADHTQRYTYDDNTIQTAFRIPFVIYAPKILSPQKIDYTVSQADLIPTLYHLFEIEDAFSATGTNALDKNANHFALISDGANIALVEGDNYIKHDRKRVVQSSFSNHDSKKFKTMQETLLSLDKSIVELFRKNKWYNPKLDDAR
ncbi:alkaline phosphatase [Endomicrobiia bacterium]|nr:alkaline phosphatase [Endomicrobiia bacterium]